MNINQYFSFFLFFLTTKIQSEISRASEDQYKLNKHHLILKPDILRSTTQESSNCRSGKSTFFRVVHVRPTASDITKKLICETRTLKLIIQVVF